LKRTLEVLSVAIFLAGVELATGGLSTTLDRFIEQFTLVFGEPPASGRGVAGLLLTFSGIALGSIALWAHRERRELTETTDCPRCGARTERIKRRKRHRILAALLGEGLTRRRCAECGWVGLTQKP